MVELTWLSSAGVADALQREGDFRAAQRLYERLAADCPVSLHACRTREIYLDLANAAERAGDPGLARTARAAHARGEVLAAQPGDASLEETVRQAIALRPAVATGLDLTRAEHILAGAIEAAGASGVIAGAGGEQISSWSLRRALTNIYLATGRPERALAVLPEGEAAGDLTEIADDLERWQQFAAAERLRRKDVVRHRAYADRSPIPANRYALALRLDALARNLHVQRRYEEAARLYLEALPVHRSVITDNDPERQRRIAIAAASFGAYRAGWSTARRLYLEARDAHLRRQSYLNAATAAGALERHDAVPMFREIVRNSWNLSR